MSDKITAKVKVDASLDEVHDALTNDDKLVMWWSAGWAGCEIVEAHVDARKGGSFRIDSMTRRGQQHWIAGRFMYVGPRLLAFTWQTDGSTKFASTVFLKLTAQGAKKTEIEVEHDGVTVELERSRIEQGWHQILEVLGRGLPRLNEQRNAPEVEAFLKQNPDCA